MKLSLETSGWEVRAAPTEPSPATMFNTPAGSPASFSKAARATVESGVYSEHWGYISGNGKKTDDFSNCALKLQKPRNGKCHDTFTAPITICKIRNIVLIKQCQTL